MMPIIIKTIINIDKNHKKIWEEKKIETIWNETEHKCNEMKKSKTKKQ